MLGQSQAIAFVGVADLNRARAFYEGVLGLTVLSQDLFAVVAEAGGVRLRITQVPVVLAAPYTVFGFEVGDIDAKLEGLTARGVAFERYPFFGAAQDPRGLWAAPDGTKVAWFKDPDGNLLSLSQFA